MGIPQEAGIGRGQNKSVLTEELADYLTAHPDDQVQVLIFVNDRSLPADLPPLLEILRTAQEERKRDHKLPPLKFNDVLVLSKPGSTISVTADPNFILTLAGRPDIRRVSLDILTGQL